MRKLAVFLWVAVVSGAGCKPSAFADCYRDGTCECSVDGQGRDQCACSNTSACNQACEDDCSMQCLRTPDCAVHGRNEVTLTCSASLCRGEFGALATLNCNSSTCDLKAGTQATASCSFATCNLQLGDHSSVTCSNSACRVECGADCAMTCTGENCELKATGNSTLHCDTATETCADGRKVCGKSC